MLFLGISVPSDGWHAPDEKVELDLLLKGAETSAHLWGDLAEHWAARPLTTHADRSGRPRAAHWKSRAAAPHGPGPCRPRPPDHPRPYPYHRGSWKHP
ncbi:hypothetical protein STENM223S_10003 [Streptomyces tendae]